MKSMFKFASRTRSSAAAVTALALMLGACVEEGGQPIAPLLPPEPPSNPEVVAAAWQMDVFRNTGKVVITPPTRGSLDGLQIIADYFGVEPGSPDLSILAGDVVNIVPTGTLSTSALNAFIPGAVRTTFDVAIQNNLTSVDLITPTFPAPPTGTTGVILFPFQVTVTETPGGVSVGGDGTDVLVELPNQGQVQPSVDWDLAPFNFFNDDACGPTDNDCYRSEVFNSTAGSIAGGATSESRTVGFDHEPTVSQFRVRMIVAADLSDATPNALPTAVSGGPYSGFVGTSVVLNGSGSDSDGTIAAYNWDFDNDGAFDDATGQTPSFQCTAAGVFPIALEVTDNRSGTASEATTVDCTVAPNLPPTANAGGPYTGSVGATTSLDGSGSTDADGSIVLYEWDLDDDGFFDDATGASASFTCSAVGTFNVSLQVTDDGSPVGVASETTTVTCGAALSGTIRGRWLDAGGNPVTSVSAGSGVILQLDIEMGAGFNIDNFQAAVTFQSGLLTGSAGGIDLACNAGADCPSANPVPAGNTDVMTFFTAGAPTATTYGFSTFSIAGVGTGVQGLAALPFQAASAGVVSVTLPAADLVAFGDGGTTDLESGLQIIIPDLTIN